MILLVFTWYIKVPRANSGKKFQARATGQTDPRRFLIGCGGMLAIARQQKLTGTTTALDILSYKRFNS